MTEIVTSQEVRNPHYLLLNGFNIYHLRLPVPKHLQCVIKQREIKRSLRTGNRREALRKARILAGKYLKPIVEESGKKVKVPAHMQPGTSKKLGSFPAVKFSKSMVSVILGPSLSTLVIHKEMTNEEERDGLYIFYTKLPLPESFRVHIPFKYSS